MFYRFCVQEKYIDNGKGYLGQIFKIHLIKQYLWKGQFICFWELLCINCTSGLTLYYQTVDTL